MPRVRPVIQTLFIGIVVAVVTAAAAAQPTMSKRAAEKLGPRAAAPGIDRFMKIRAPSRPVLAADGTLYVVDWPDGVNQLYRRAAGAPIDAPMKKLTEFPDGLSDFALAPDDRTIILSAGIGGNEQFNLYALNVATDAVTPLLQNPSVVFNFQRWLADSSGFIYTANDTSPSDFHIYRYDLASGERTKLLAEPGHWSVADVTADGARLLAEQYFSESKADAYEVQAASGRKTRLSLGEGETYNAPACYLPDGRSALIISDVEGGIPRLFVRDLAGPGAAPGAPRKPWPDLDQYPIEAVHFNVAHDAAAVIYNEGGYGTMRLVELPSFKDIDLPEIDRGLVTWASVRGRTITWMLSNARTPELSFAFEIGSGAAAPRPLTIADTQGIDIGGFTLPELVTYQSFDGRDIPAFLFTPAGFMPNRAVPFIINFHGGPEGQSRPGFNRTIQYFVARGFGVMQPNVRGSTGYGREFHMLDNYTARWDSVKDGVEAARWLVANGYARPGRVAAYGGSYGGFMAVATVIEGSDVFGAAVDVVGIVNFKTFLEQTKDYRRKLREAEYGPLTDPDFLASISPLNRLDEIKVPMFIAHGLNDPRVPVGEAMQLAVGLQKRGYDPELLFFPDEGHGFAKLENRLLFAERMAKFLDQHIGF
jgi:dipeptidyl aminopeptidase/acylaminoacyl peptidase